MSNVLYAEKTYVQEMNAIPYYDRRILVERIEDLEQKVSLAKQNELKLLDFLKNESPELFNKFMNSYTNERKEMHFSLD